MLFHYHHLVLCFLFPALCLLVAPITIHAYSMNGVNLTLTAYSTFSKPSCSSEFQTGIAFYVASLTEQNQFASDSAYQCHAQDYGGFCCWPTSMSLVGRSYMLYNFAVSTGCITVSTYSCDGAIEFAYFINATKHTGGQVIDFGVSNSYGATFAPSYYLNMTTDAIEVQNFEFGYWFTVTPLDV